MSDFLFGVAVQEYVPVDVFPYDPDFGFKRTPTWQTTVLQYSPLLEQRIYSGASSPTYEFEIGFSVLRSGPDKPSPAHWLQTLYLFYVNHRGNQTPFYFYDPVPWSTLPPGQYRDNPPSRLTYPGGPEGFNPATGRYVMLFEDNELSFEQFEHRLQRSNMKLRGYRDF